MDPSERVVIVLSRGLRSGECEVVLAVARTRLTYTYLIVGHDGGVCHYSLHLGTSCHMPSHAVRQCATRAVVGRLPVGRAPFAHVLVGQDRVSTSWSGEADSIQGSQVVWLGLNCPS